MSSKINAGLVHEGDEVVLITSTLIMNNIVVQNTQVFPVPSDTILCWVNKQLRINLLDKEEQSDINEIIEVRKKQFEELKK